MHPSLPPRSWRENLVNFLVIVLGFALAFALALLTLVKERERVESRNQRLPGALLLSCVPLRRRAAGRPCNLGRHEA